MNAPVKSSDYIRALVCGWPEPERSRRLLVMLQGYADDSGSDGTRLPYVLAGYVLESERWAKFSDEWQDELFKAPSIDYFKMSEANERDGQFSRMSREIVDGKIRQLASVILRHQPRGIFSYMNWQDYRELFLPIFLPETKLTFLRNPYHVLFGAIFDALESYQKSLGTFPETVDFDFDEQGSLGQFPLFLWDAIKMQGPRKRRKMLGRTPTMLDDKKVMPLQAADMLAWTLRHALDPEDEAKRYLWLFELLKPTYKSGFQVTRESLEKSLKRRKSAKFVSFMREYYLTKRASIEAQKFDDALSVIMSVSHDELKRREEEWKKQRRAKGYKRVRS
jgi:hypothetical protein